MALKTFRRGSSTYTCNVCERTTRDTGDNGQSRLCPQCWDLAGIENSVSDGYYTADEAKRLAAPLIAQIAAKGGDTLDWTVTFGVEVKR